MDKIQLRDNILKKIERPIIPSKEYSALSFGVIPDSEKVQTIFLQKAIDCISESGGGRLILPAGRYLTGALQLKSKVDLHLESQDTVLAFVNEDPELHYPVVFSHWEATPCYNFSSLIYACDSCDIALTGKGILDGGADADHWWNWHHQVENAWSSNKTDLQLKDRSALRRMNEEGVPVEQRVFGPGHYLRPNFVQFIRCKRLLLQGFTLKNSPMWQLNPVMCSSFTVDGVTMSSHGANNDGCDPESCDGVYICNCRFDTGDDCISLKSGRDRDGRLANVPCRNVLIENNEFADGHGGIALGSEMSGGIFGVVAVNNRFSSPNLTYALRLKTNARRGGRVENIILADSVMNHVHGAAVHGTMLYEDGRNGSYLPLFRNITIENITAHGGDYGIFLEAFEEVPVTGLILRNITIDGVKQLMRSMNWKDPVIEQVKINGKSFPRPGNVRILGITAEGNRVAVSAENCGGVSQCRFFWQTSTDGISWKEAGTGLEFEIREPEKFLRVAAEDEQGNREYSHAYRILSGNEVKSTGRQRLLCRGMLHMENEFADDELITRDQLAHMLLPLADPSLCSLGEDKKQCSEALRISVGNGFLALDAEGNFRPDGYVSRQEMATVAMQACGVIYRNASSTMPICADVEKVGNNYGTNVARSLYFGFMKLTDNCCFMPERFVTVGEAVEILNRVADFAGF